MKLSAYVIITQCKYFTQYLQNSVNSSLSDHKTVEIVHYDNNEFIVMTSVTPTCISSAERQKDISVY